MSVLIGEKNFLRALIKSNMKAPKAITLWRFAGTMKIK
jgi:hypothetical protein